MANAGVATTTINLPTAGMERRTAAEEQPSVSSLYARTLIPAEYNPASTIIHVQPPRSYASSSLQHWRAMSDYTLPSDSESEGKPPGWMHWWETDATPSDPGSTPSDPPSTPSEEEEDGAGNASDDQEVDGGAAGSDADDDEEEAADDEAVARKEARARARSLARATHRRRRHPFNDDRVRLQLLDGRVVF